jgi:lipopolysaccharide transport system ATP-binding protein
MKRTEIKAKFDEIVAFAEVEKFLDTPVKRYSSGMYVRLAFAVAAHLEPEILIVDEVLAVGDAEFQKKCLGKMESVAKGEGRTVLFVSHQMQAITQMCSRALLLRSGTAADGLEDVRTAVKRYAEATSSADSAQWSNPGTAFDHPAFKPERVFIGGADGKLHPLPLEKSDEAWLYVEFTVAVSDPAFQVGYELFTPDAAMLYMTFATDQEEARWPARGAGRFRVRSRMPLWLLNDGTYRLELTAGLRWRQWFCVPGAQSPALQFELCTSTNNSPYWTERRKGILAPLLTWEEC